jgi:hypothetical protein
MTKIGNLEGLFQKLGELRSAPRKGQVLVVLRASGCATGEVQASSLIQNLDLLLLRMVESARGQCYRLDGLDYAFLLDDSNEAAREFIPNVRIALFKVLSRIGAGQSSAEGKGLVLEHYKLETDFADVAKIINGYIKAVREVKAGRAAAGDGSRLLIEQDLKTVIEAYRKIGAVKFLKTFARGQQICVIPERGPIKPKMTEFYISIDLLRKPFFEGVDLRASGDRFVELTKILDTIMLNSFETLAKVANGQRITINLNVPSIFSKAFENFIEKTPSDVMRNVVVEFRQEDAVLNYDGYAIARDQLRSKGAQIAIDQIEPSAIGLVNIGFLDAQIAKLHWHADGEDNFYDRQEVVEKFRKAGIQPVLSRVDEERACTVGSDLGIEMYQGFLIDTMIKAAAAA